MRRRTTARACPAPAETGCAVRRPTACGEEAAPVSTPSNVPVNESTTPSPVHLRPGPVRRGTGRARGAVRTSRVVLGGRSPRPKSLIRTATSRMTLAKRASNRATRTRCPTTRSRDWAYRELFVGSGCPLPVSTTPPLAPLAQRLDNHRRRVLRRLLPHEHIQVPVVRKPHQPMAPRLMTLEPFIGLLL